MDVVKNLVINMSYSGIMSDFVYRREILSEETCNFHQIEFEIMSYKHMAYSLHFIFKYIFGFFMPVLDGAVKRDRKR